MTAQFHLSENTGRYLPLRPVTPKDIIEKAKQLVAATLRRDSKCLCDPSAVRDYPQLELAKHERETFWTHGTAS